MVVDKKGKIKFDTCYFTWSFIFIMFIARRPTL
jgi:hypothetical protein